MSPSKKAEKFKSIGFDIIHKRRINTISEFLNNPPDQDPGDSLSEMDTNPRPKTNSITITGGMVNQKKLGRLHIQINQDLLDRLLKTVFERKRDRNITTREATQRAIIEEALEGYFKRNETEDQNL